MLVTAAEILRHQEVPAEYRLYDLKLAGDKIPRLLKGAEFAARSYLKGVVPISMNPKFRNRVKGKYDEMILNYYFAQALPLSLDQEGQCRLPAPTSLWRVHPSLDHFDPRRSLRPWKRGMRSIARADGRRIR